MREGDLVALKVDRPESGLRKGDVGAVVLVYPGGETYAVEFVDHRGETVALLDLTREEVEPLRGSTILHLRETA
jgi:hypothetical protein